MPVKEVFLRAEEDAGSHEAFADAALYDFEYRRRRADINFYRRLADNRMQFAPAGPLLDLACGTGRLLIPWLRDGHRVVGLDRSAPMLAAARRRLARLSPSRRQRGLVVQADLRDFALQPNFVLAVAAFHSVQHLYTSGDVLRFLRAARAALVPGGWLAFDVLPPDPEWIGRDPNRRWGRTVFRHPQSGQRLVYTNNHRFDARRRVLHIRLYYQPLDQRGRPDGPERMVRLCHRQLEPSLVRDLLARAGFRLLTCFGGFDGRQAMEKPGLDDEHIYIAAAR